MIKCSHCQAENREGAAFCNDCGKAFQKEVVCRQCGKPNPADAKFCDKCGLQITDKVAETSANSAKTPITPSTLASVPASFANGRYQVKKFLGEGGKKKVYLAHDTTLDRDVAFALIKTEKLDDAGRTRIKREAQAMGRLGDHPNIVTVFDFGDHEGQPYLVLPLLSGGDVEGLIKKAPQHKLPLEQGIEIARSVAKGLEFAHTRGIIHRDIKPGNVWLSADGTAKVGDFGLAVAVDLSRLTQAGMMVGTVSYMPPEQAMGGQVSARADLYSLGAMLYEMVTGRPPFIGDDSIAIIGQHINTPPVSPTWHRADLPPALDTLIMQLLEKDPGKRPQSATVVLQALDSIESGKAAKVESPKEAKTSVENPLYRRVFVGREAELKQLQSAFDGALSGQGSLTMVLGEPGIGKTALCEQLATYVTLRGGKALVGHCYEEGSLSLPYLAFVEALRSYAMENVVEDLRKQLGSGATDVARIVSEIREKLDIQPRVGDNPEEDRYRLLQAVTGFLTHAAAVKPLLVVLEDLHDADKGTLEMLTYISRNLAGARLLLVGTYRDVEVDRTHPLSGALAELRRLSTFRRVILRGLNADEVQRMLKSIAAQDIPWGLAEAVHRQTEGNPLFVQEVIRYLNEEGLILREGGMWKGKSGARLEISIPEGLLDVIGKRLSRLSKECNELLSVASVIGREFAIETLRAVAGINEDIFIQALKEAIRLSILEERSQVGLVRYRFTHAFFRQTLYEELIAPQRLRLHQQVARTLESQYDGRLEEHAAELAEHFSQSTDQADLRKAITYGQMAAKRARNVYAYSEAARLLEQALKVQKVLDPDDKSRICDLILDLCEILLDIPDAGRVLEVEAPAAFALAESLGDSSRAVRACNAALNAIVNEYATPGYTTPQFRQWAERADRYAKPNTVERARADLALGCIKCETLREVKAGHKLLIQSLDLARQLGDRPTFYLAAGALLMYRTAPQHTAERLSLAKELESSLVGGRHSAMPKYYIGDTLMSVGQRQRAEEAWSDFRSLEHRDRGFFPELFSMALESVLAVMDGRLEEAVKLAEDIRNLGDQAGAGKFADVWGSLALFRAGVYLGTPFASRLPGNMGILLILVRAYEGKKEEVGKILEAYVVKRPGAGTLEDETMAWADALLLEASVLSGHRPSAEMLLNRFSCSGLCTTGAQYPTCIIRHMGGAAALLGRNAEARALYQEAIKVCIEMKFRPELALTRLQLAVLLLEHFPDEKAEAAEHLDFAIKEFREMKMRPSLETALRHKNILKA